MAPYATLFKACRFSHFFRQGCWVEPKGFGKAFTDGRGKFVLCPASSPHSFPGLRAVFCLEKNFSACRFSVIDQKITHSMLHGSSSVIHEQLPVASCKTRTHSWNRSEGSREWCWSGAIGPSSSDFMCGFYLIRNPGLSTLSISTVRKQGSFANNGHLNSFEAVVRCEDSIVSPKPVSWNLILGKFRTSNGTFQVWDGRRCREAVVNLDALNYATRRGKSRTKKAWNERPVMGRHLTPSYVVQLLQQQKDPNLAFMFFQWAGQQRGYKHTCGTYCALIAALARSKKFSAVKQVKEEIEAKGLKCSAFLLREMGVALSRGGLVEETVECLKRMDDLGHRPTLRLYNKLVNMLVKAGFPDRAHFLYRRMVDAGCHPDAYTFNHLLAGYGKSRDFVNMWSVFEEMKHQSCKSTPVTIAILLNVLCKAGKVDEALYVFTANKDLANVVVCNTMLHGLCKVGRTEQSLELFEEMKQKKLPLESATFNILIDGLGRANRTKDAIQLFQSMADHKVEPDVLTYNVTLKVLVKDERLHEAYRIFKEMATKGLTPDVITYGTLIHGYCVEGDLDSACHLFTKMQASSPEYVVASPASDQYEAGQSEVGVLSSKGSKSSRFRVYNVACTILCSYLLERGRYEVARELFQETVKADANLFLYAYNAAIHRLGSGGDIDEALELFQSMSVHGFKPDVVTYNTLISCLGKAKQVDRACDLFSHMQASGCKPDVVTCTTLVDALCKSDRAERALDLFKEMQVQGISPNVFTYHSLFDGLCREGQLSKAYMLYENMIERHCVPNEVMYRSLIRGFSNASHLVGHSIRLYIEMLERGYSLDPLTSYILVRALRRAGKAGEALKVVCKSQGREKFKMLNQSLYPFRS